MLRNIDPLLSPELLHLLALMGHGDEIVIADANFPAASIGPQCARMMGADTSDILRAVLTLLPLDNFVPDPALCMQVVGDPTQVPETVTGFQSIINATADAPGVIRGSGLTRISISGPWSGATIVG